MPAGALIEAMVNNYATQKCPKAKRWLARHPRWTFYLIVDLQTATDRYRLRKPGVEFASAGQSAPSTQMSRAQIRSDGVQSDHVAIRAHIGPGAKSSPFIHQLAPLVEQVTARIRGRSGMVGQRETASPGKRMPGIAFMRSSHSCLIFSASKGGFKKFPKLGMTFPYDQSERKSSRTPC